VPWSVQNTATKYGESLFRVKGQLDQDNVQWQDFVAAVVNFRM
jgi:hypothetical protein